MSRYSHDPTTHTLSLISGTNPDDYNFVGTTAEWEALTPVQKAQYESRDIIDDFNGDSIDSTPTYNSPHAVSSGGTYNAIKAVSDAIPTVDNIPTESSTNPISSGAMFSALDDIDGELTANNKKFYFDYQDGKYGYNTSAARGADTFVPFNSYKRTYTICGGHADNYAYSHLILTDMINKTSMVKGAASSSNWAWSYSDDYISASAAVGSLSITLKVKCLMSNSVNSSMTYTEKNAGSTVSWTISKGQIVTGSFFFE